MKTSQKFCRCSYLARIFNLDELIIAISCDIAMFDKENKPLYDRDKVKALKAALDAAKLRKKNLDSDLARRGWQICCGCGCLVPLFHRQYCEKCQEKINAGQTLQN